MIDMKDAMLTPTDRSSRVQVSVPIEKSVDKLSVLFHAFGAESVARLDLLLLPSSSLVRTLTYGDSLNDAAIVSTVLQVGCGLHEQDLPVRSTA